MYKTKRPFFIAIFIVLVLVCLFTIFFAIPQAAKMTLPNRWRSIPVGEKRDVLVQYLGWPSGKDTATFIANGDNWIALRENGEFRLHVVYNPADTTITHYQLRFHYKLGFFRKSYLLDEK